VDVLLRLLEQRFNTRVSESMKASSLDLTSKVAWVRLQDSAHLVNMQERNGTSPLGKEAPTKGKKKGKGCFAEVQAQLDLTDKMLVVACVPGNSHFSLLLWLPPIDKAFTMDSYTLCRHASIVQSTFKPFMEFVSQSPVEVIAKDHTNGIERQPASGADANVCGFAVMCFVSKVLDALLETVESSAGHELLEELSSQLGSMTVQADEYAQYRRMAKIDLVHACEEYRRHVSRPHSLHCISLHFT